MKYLTRSLYCGLVLIVLAPAAETQETCDTTNSDFTNACESPTAFCGANGLCMEYSCDNWYMYSPWNVANQTNSSLACEPFDNTNIWSVVYACQNYPDKGAKLYLDQKCSATIVSTGETFNCFNFTAGTDFQKFLSSYTNNAPDCSSNADVPFPFFQYRLTYDSPNEKAPITVDLQGNATSQEFNANLSRMAIFTQLVSKNPPPTPTPLGPGSEPPVPAGGIPNKPDGSSGALYQSKSFLIAFFIGYVMILAY